MKRPSEAFIGTMIGLMLVLLAPSTHMHSEEDLVLWLVVFPGLGAFFGTIIGMLRRRRA